MKRIILAYAIITISTLYNFTNAQEYENIADGPYVIYLPNGNTRIVSTNLNGEIKDTIYNGPIHNLPLSVTSHSGKHQFEVKLHTIDRRSWKSTKPENLFVISDPHGNMDCFVSVLLNNRIIDKDYNWIYGRNHLMVIGDVFDRGKDVLPIFWLIYKLEKEAGDTGGQVSFLLGNHEPMVLAGDYRYMEKMYTGLAEKVGMEYRELFGPDTELGRWLLTRNTMQMVGEELFVHAGLSKDFLEKDLSIELVNKEMSRGLYMTKQERKDLSPLTEFLYTSMGPIWYRGMVRNDEKYSPLHPDDLELILQRYNAKRIIVGHTIFPDIKNLYGGRVVTVNVDNKDNFKSVSGRGILIKNDKTYVISDKGIQRELYFYD